MRFRDAPVKREDIDLWLKEFMFRKTSSLPADGCHKIFL
jgi:hypothetical protein